MNKTELNEIVRLHGLWYRGQLGGSRAVLTDADLKRADLTDADLKGAVLTDADLRGAVLTDADLRGAVLTDADLRRADLRGADLRGADLTRADLRGADLRGHEIPVIENIDAVILAKITSDGCALKMDKWHTCETTHCRGGWAVLLAGERGLALEKSLGTNAAASLIYAVSRPNERVPNWLANDEDAMADIKKHAEVAA